jgi:hypothetical protein
VESSQNSLNFLVGDIGQVGATLLEALNSFLRDIDAYDFCAAFGESDSQRQPDISEPNNSHRFIAPLHWNHLACGINPAFTLRFNPPSICTTIYSINDFSSTYVWNLKQMRCP